MKKLIVISILPLGALFADPVVSNMVHIGRTSVGYGRNSYPNGAESVSVGDNACRNSYRIHFSEFVGNFAGMLATNVRNCVAVGERALAGAYSCNNVIAIGTGAGQTMRYGTNVTMIGNHFFASEQANEMKLSPYWCYSTNAPIWYKDGKMFLNATNGVYVNNERYAGGGGGGVISGDLTIKHGNLKVEPAVDTEGVYYGGDFSCGNAECTNLVVEGGFASYATISSKRDPRLIICGDHGNSESNAMHVSTAHMYWYGTNKSIRCWVNLPGYDPRCPLDVGDGTEIYGTMLLDTTAEPTITNVIQKGTWIDRREYVEMYSTVTNSEYFVMNGTVDHGQLIPLVNSPLADTNPRCYMYVDTQSGNLKIKLWNHAYTLTPDL